MQFRKLRSIVPKRLLEKLFILFICSLPPLVIGFEAHFVLLELCEYGSWTFYASWLLALYISFNYYGNFFLCVLINTTITHESLAKKQTKQNAVACKSWHICKICNISVPPRAWHCNTCGICIVKRDHHCLFTGCCIGHHNHRYFYVFLMYMLIGCLIALIYNLAFVWKYRLDLMKHYYILFGWIDRSTAATLDSSIKFLAEMFCLCKINLMLLTIPLAYVIIYAIALVKGREPHRWRARSYNFGVWQNFKIVFGERVFLTWLSPFVASELPHDGTNWEIIQNEELKQK